MHAYISLAIFYVKKRNIFCFASILLFIYFACSRNKRTINKWEMFIIKKNKYIYRICIEIKFSKSIFYQLYRLFTIVSYQKVDLVDQI